MQILPTHHMASFFRPDMSSEPVLWAWDEGSSLHRCLYIPSLFLSCLNICVCFFFFLLKNNVACVLPVFMTDSTFLQAFPSPL